MNYIFTQQNKLYPNPRVIQVLEERLKSHEDRIAEEFAFVEAVYKNHKELGNKSVNELVEFSEKMLKDAKAVLEKKPAGANPYDLKHLKREIDSLEYSILSIHWNKSRIIQRTSMSFSKASSDTSWLSSA